MKIKSKLIIAIALAICNISIASQFNLNLENDCFLPDKSLGKNDDDFTHGTTLEYIFDSSLRLKLGQNMYAPSDLSREDHIVGDRPYAGLIYGGVGYDFFKNYNPYWTHYGEIDFGMIGPAAFAGHTQRFVHKILNCRDPKGWHNQLHNEFVVNGQWWEKYNWYLCDYVALVPRTGILVGTIQDAIEVGCDLKIGWNLKNDSGNSIMFSSSPTKSKSFWNNFSIYGYVGVDERYYLYNHILQGTMFGHRDDGLDVDIKPFVGEIQTGIGMQIYNLVMKYYMVIRQDEYEHQKHAPNYAGICIGWCW